ncbi:hypothetical protein QYF36_023365 [Acer negundo]|nr:hypothetical protein QYF36_023365 [Acer negundo]
MPKYVQALGFDLRLLRFLLLWQAQIFNTTAPINSSSSPPNKKAENDVVSLSPNLDKSFNIPFLISQNQNEAMPNSSSDRDKSSSPALVLYPLLPLPSPEFKKFGIVIEN